MKALRAHENMLPTKFSMCLQCNYSPLLSFQIPRFKNGKPSPWSRDISSLIVDPKAENQTIYTRTISYNDAGNYTCVMRNATHKREHHIELIVFGKLCSPFARTSAAHF